MFTTTGEAAAMVFEESLLSLMAHTISGLKRLFSKHQLDLEVRLIPDHSDRIGLLRGADAPPSILITRHRDTSYVANRGHVSANIFIHRYANKHLARLCIAHEAFHLLVELKAFVASAPKPAERIWPTRDLVLNPQNKQFTDEERLMAIKKLESDCDVFAWDLCRQHDQFNRNEGERSKHIYFPDRTFETALKTSNLRNRAEWPAGIDLSPDHPWWKK